MKNLSLSEFREYYNKMSFGKVVYSAANQAWYSVDSTSSAELVFGNVLFSFNPNIIYFKNKESFLRLNKVKTVKLHEEDCLLGVVFTVVCGDIHNDLNNKHYTLIAN